MRFDVLTLFPDMVDNICGTSIIGRACESGKISVHSHNIRDFSKDKHRRVDDTPYGGGKGMLMAAPPICDCHEFVMSQEKDKYKKTLTVYMSPSGKVLDNKTVKRLSGYDRIIILCGHYEGVDYRVIEEIVDEEISIGDYVLTGGELPACVLIDSVARLVPDVLASSECHEMESIACGMLEYPQYTRPYEFRGRKVPDVLLNGNHKEIDEWRYKTALELTKKKRPDLM